MDPFRSDEAIRSMEYDRMQPNGHSHLDRCPLASEFVDDDALCICDELQDEAREDAKTIEADYRMKGDN